MKTPNTSEKKLMYFVAIYRDDKDGGFWSRFVDFHAADQGDTVEDAIAQAAEFLQGIVDDYTAATGKSLPPASDIDQFKAKLDPADGEVVCIAPVFAYKPSPTVRVQLTAKANRIAEIDVFARKHGLSRSELMVKATTDFIRANA